MLNNLREEKYENEGNKLINPKLIMASIEFASINWNKIDGRTVSSNSAATQSTQRPYMKRKEDDIQIAHLTNQLLL